MKKLMKQHVKWILIISILVVILNCIPNISFAQIDPGGDPDAPIDGGVSLLIAAGVGYGVKKVRDARKKQNKINDF